MMPVAGQDAVLDAATIQRETHMRTAVVEREDVPILVYEEYWAMAAVHNKPALGFQLLKGAGARKFRGHFIHRYLIRQGSAAAQFSRAVVECQSSFRHYPAGR